MAKLEGERVEDEGEGSDLFDLLEVMVEEVESFVPEGEASCEIWVCAWFTAAKLWSILATTIPGSGVIVAHSGAEQLLATRPKDFYQFWVVRTPQADGGVVYTYLLPVGEDEENELILRKREITVTDEQSATALFGFEINEIRAAADEFANAT